MTFSCKGSKWKIDVNALTQNQFTRTANSQFWGFTCCNKNNYSSRGSTTQPANVSHKSDAVDRFVFPPLSLSLWMLEAASVRQRGFIIKRELPVAFILTASAPDIDWMAEWRRNLQIKQRGSKRRRGEGGGGTEAGRKKLDRRGLMTEWRRKATSPSVKLQKPPCADVPALEEYTSTSKQRHSPCKCAAGVQWQYTLELAEPNSNRAMLGQTVRAAPGIDDDYGQRAKGGRETDRIGLSSQCEIQSLCWYNVVSSSCVPLLYICIMLPKPLVYLFICTENIGHSIHRNHTFLIVVQLQFKCLQGVPVYQSAADGQYELNKNNT